MWVGGGAYDLAKQFALVLRRSVKTVSNVLSEEKRERMEQHMEPTAPHRNGLLVGLCSRQEVHAVPKPGLN